MTNDGKFALQHTQGQIAALILAMIEVVMACPDPERAAPALEAGNIAAVDGSVQGRRCNQMVRTITSLRQHATSLLRWAWSLELDAA
jgi:hypothetical protein